MVEQHTAAKQAGAHVISRTGLMPSESPKSKELQAAGKQHLERLNAADDANFDITYLTGQIEQHATVLKLIEDQLLPAVNDPTLRDQLQNARGMVQQHLDQARQIQK
jgi:putative membrane protein